MSSSDKKLYQTLLELDLIEEKVLAKLLKKTTVEKSSLHSLIVNEGLMSDKNLGQITADMLDLPFIELVQTKIQSQDLNLISESFARHNKVLVYGSSDEYISVATSNPEDYIALDALKKSLNKKIKLNYATESDINQALLLYQKDAKTIFASIIEENVRSAKGDEKNEPPIIKIVDTIISYADQKKASDIHIEPLDDVTLIRFRLDGVMTDVVSLPPELHDRIVTRIKVMSKLRTDEHLSAQDGKISWSGEGTESFSKNEIDLRVSIIPAVNGEKVVMRLLSERSRQLTLTDLGFSKPDLVKLTEAYKRPHGMLLSTGPTGSGKTTTMYTILKLLNSREVNISTIEDPVEYSIDGITQIQVNKQTDLTFAKGLRSIVRQDPDIILVGEIRDPETADIAINSAMTGHLVLSTLHTNDSTTTIPRLIDMEVEPFLISSTINVVVAQRLVRKIHIKCRKSHEVSKKELTQLFDEETANEILGSSESIRTYKGEGCDICQHTGYSGRIGIFELLFVDDEIRKAIVSKEDTATIRDIAIKNGMTTMAQDGFEKVKEGITTLDEVIRVTKEFD